MAITVEEEIKALGINPGKVLEEMRSFRRSATRLSTDRPRMIEQFPDQWVALYLGRVEAHAEEYDTVLRMIDEKGIPREHAIVRFIESEPSTMIL